MPARPVPSRIIVAGSGMAEGAAVNPRITSPLPMNPTRVAAPVATLMVKSCDSRHRFHRRCNSCWWDGETHYYRTNPALILVRMTVSACAAMAKLGQSAAQARVLSSHRRKRDMIVLLGGTEKHSREPGAPTARRLGAEAGDERGAKALRSGLKKTSSQADGRLDHREAGKILTWQRGEERHTRRPVPCQSRPARSKRHPAYRGPVETAEGVRPK